MFLEKQWHLKGLSYILSIFFSKLKISNDYLLRWFHGNGDDLHFFCVYTLSHDLCWLIQYKRNTFNAVKIWKKYTLKDVSYLSGLNQGQQACSDDFSRGVR